MKRLGFIHDMMDVKVLILFVTARSNYPMTGQEIYELCYQDECLSYFDVCAALPEMVESGHLEVADEKYTITEKGRQDGAITEDSLAFTVRQSAENAVAKFNRQIRRSSYVKTQIIPREKGDYSVVMSLDDDMGNLMTMELVAPDRRQATRLSRLFEIQAEAVYSGAMNTLLQAEDQID